MLRRVEIKLLMRIKRISKIYLAYVTNACINGKL